MRRLLASVILLTGIAALPAHAADRSSEYEAKALLLDAIIYMRDNGSDAAMAAFNEKSGEFRREDLYVFAFGTDGTYLASGANPTLAGSDASELADALGTPIFKAALDGTEKAAMTTINYEWLNRETNDLEEKTSFVVRESGVLIGVGYYKE